ncbi:hypothetical protein NQ318_002043 [Aromia moschata]|uniref:Major facilitator superfamily (MFS) profile domain-containing protein n=1 Tax=Aromia moschata TaxID=1265417 RepID=A0AAV8Z1U4_9CUCU|nr:hypothetical protein NQ318_002043 [Aromia moschata]
MKVFVRADTHVSSIVLDGEPKPKFTISQLITAVAVSFISMVIGYMAAYTSPTQNSLEKEFHVTTNQMSWISSFMPFGALFGALCGGTLIEHLGRKWSILVTNFLFLIAWTVIYCAEDYRYLYAGRIIGGVGVGIASLTLPVYLAETLHPKVRGTLGLVPSAFGNIGILSCFLSGIVYQWRTLALIGGILSTPFLLLIWWIPESPRFLMMRGKEEKSKRSLRWLRGTAFNVDKEHVELQNSLRQPYNQNERMRILFSRNILKLLFIVLGLMFFQQMTGINAVIFYTTKIFRDTGSTWDENICTTIVGLVNFMSTFIAATLIDRWGRKLLLYVSSISMVFALGILGTYFYLKDNKAAIVDLQRCGWVPLSSFILYILGFSLGFGPIPWLMMGEILPGKIRGPAASISAAFAWTCTFTVTKTFLPINEVVGTHYTLWLFAVMMLVALAFIKVFVPETMGQSLDDIERKLAGVKIKPMSSVGNLRPMPSIY